MFTDDSTYANDIEAGIYLVPNTTGAESRPLIKATENIQNISLINKSATFADSAVGIKNRGGNLYLTAAETLQIIGANEKGEQDSSLRWMVGLWGYKQSETILQAKNLIIDAATAIAAQDENSKIRILGENVKLQGNIYAFGGADIAFEKISGTEQLVTVISDQEDAVIANPYDPSAANIAASVVFNTNTVINVQKDQSTNYADASGLRKIAAIRALRLSEVKLNDSESTYYIYGDIIAGRGVDSSNDIGGIVDLGGSGSVIRGDVLAGNTGTINLSLKSGASFEGRVDDYQDADTTTANGDGMVFRPAEFDVDVTESGSVNMTIADSTWTARHRNFVSKIEFAGADASKNLIDMSRDANSSLTVKELSGSGTIKMRISAESDKDGFRQTDMLYVGKLAEDAQIHIDLDVSAFDSYEDLEGIRFATTTGDYFSEGSVTAFSARLQDQGFFNRNLEIHTEQYVTGDAENSSYNGSADGSVEGESGGKPGQTYVDSVFGSNTSTNWYIGAVKEDEGGDTGEEPGGDTNPPAGPTISDAGQAIIATARGLYYNAIEIDRFNQRYGDRRYDENNKSLWARVRHDRWGTDAGVGDFKSQNTTYQMGFDYTEPNEDGKMIYGIAVDLMDGNTDYESIDGSGETKRYAVSAYATYMGDNGSYLDVVGKVGRLSNEYSVRLDSGAGVSADYINWMAGISVEAGHQLTSEGSRWFAEPQIQAQYVFVSDNDYSNGQTKIKQDDIHSFITRAGFRAGRWLGEGKNANVYFKTDVLHEWAGDQDIHVSDKTTSRGGETFSINNHGTWFDVGFGFQAPMGKSFYAYGDAEYRFGNDLYQTWTFNLGGKYVF